MMRIEVGKTYRRKDGGCTSRVLGLMQPAHVLIEAHWQDKDEKACKNKTVLPISLFEANYNS